MAAEGKLTSMTSTVTKDQTAVTKDQIYETIMKNNSTQFNEFPQDSAFRKELISLFETAVVESDLEFITNVLTLAREKTYTNYVLVHMLHYSAKSCYSIDAFHQLLKGIGNLECLDEDGETPLFNATKCANNMAAFELLKAGCHVDAINSHGRTPLHIGAASIFMPLAIVQALVEKGASVDALDCYGYSPLVLHLNNHFAFSREVKGPLGKDSMAVYLIQHGTDLNSQNTHNAFHWYFNIKHDLDMLKLAEAAGLDINSPNASWIHTKYQSLQNMMISSRRGESRMQTEFIEFYEQIFRQPLALTSICRKRIRSLVSQSCRGVRFWWKVQQLGLPKALRSYVLLEDIIHANI